MTPEGKVTSDCLKLLQRMKDAGVPVEWLKVTGGVRQKTGQPDLDICLAGRTIKDELKAPGEEATKLQTHRLKQWAAAGAITGVFGSVEDFADQMERLIGPLGFVMLRNRGKPIQVVRAAQDLQP